jgi:hypothetical protein
MGWGERGRERQQNDSAYGRNIALHCTPVPFPPLIFPSHVSVT